MLDVAAAVPAVVLLEWPLYKWDVSFRQMISKYDDIPSHILDFSKHILSLEDEINDERLLHVAKNPE